IAQSLIQLPRGAIERRDAHEHVGMLAEYAPLRERDELGADPLAAQLGGDTYGLDVTNERPAEVEDEKSRQPVVPPGDVALAALVEQDPERGLVVAAERDPGLGGRHHLGAGLGLLERSNGTDDQLRHPAPSIETNDGLAPKASRSPVIRIGL